MDKNPNMQSQPQYPPPPYYGPQGQSSTTIITSHPMIMPGVMTVTTGPAVGPHPNRTTCPSCQTEIVTRVENKATTRTHIMALILCLLCIPCVVIPYCTDSCNDANHYCPNCGSYIGTYFR